MKRFISAIAMMAIAVAMMAAPASAAANTVVVFSGTATVCADSIGGTANPACTNPSKPHGLVLPHQSGPREGNYNFQSGAPAGCIVVNTLGACGIDVTGQLSPVAGIGAACGISHGHSGSSNSATAGLTLSNVGWAASAGGTLPVTGTYSGGGTSGPIAGVVQAQGGAACANPDGAAVFNVVGVVAAL